MIQIVQLHGTDKKLYELVAPLVMSPEVLKQNYNYPFRTSEEYEWFVALDNKHVVGFVPVVSLLFFIFISRLLFKVKKTLPDFPRPGPPYIIPSNFE